MTKRLVRQRPDAAAEQAWTAEGSRLTASLQRARPDMQVWFWHDGTARLAGKTG